MSVRRATRVLVVSIVTGMILVAPARADGNARASLSVADIRIVEGSATPVIALFTIALNREVRSTVTVDYATVPGSARTGSDFTSSSGSVVLPRGETSVTVAVPVVSDAVHETPREEQFELRLVNPRRAAISDGSATATVLDDDLPPECAPYDPGGGVVAGVSRCAVPTDGTLGAIDPTVLVVLPSTYRPDDPRPVVFLLHGVGDTFETWVKRTDVETFAADQGAIIVMPDGGSGDEAGWYSNWVDGSRSWETFHTATLVRWVDESFATRVGQRAVVGASMGGFGAVYYAAAHPGVFRAAASISGVLDTQLYGPAQGYAFAAGSQPGEPFGRDDSLGTPDARVWGDPIDREETWAAHNPRKRVEQGELDHLGGALWLRTGTGVFDPAAPPPAEAGSIDDPIVEQFVWQTNQSFKLAAMRAGADHSYDERPGTHSWPDHEAFLHELLPLVVDAID